MVTYSIDTHRYIYKGLAVIEMTCEVMEGGGMKLSFATEGEDYCEFNFDDIGDLEGFLMECHEMAIIASMQGRHLNS